MSNNDTAGAIIDRLGVPIHVEDGELVESAVVITKIIDHDGNEYLKLSFSEGQSWIERAGMLRRAEQMDSTAGYSDPD